MHLALTLEGEEAPVTSRLYRQERPVQADQHERQHPLLCARERGAGGSLGEVRQDEAEHRQRNDDAQVGVRALQVVGLLAMPQATEQQRHAHQSVEQQHDDGEQRVAHQRRAIGVVHHDRRDAHDLDRGDREGEYQRAVRLAEPVREVIRMAHHRE